METKRGSIDLARRLCVEIAGFTDEEEEINGYDYDSVDIAEILSAEVERLHAREQVGWIYTYPDTSKKIPPILSLHRIDTKNDWIVRPIFAGEPTPN
jgi:hypothetical protein